MRKKNKDYIILVLAILLLYMATVTGIQRAKIGRLQEHNDTLTLSLIGATKIIDDLHNRISMLVITMKDLLDEEAKIKNFNDEVTE
jgi:hypothetical protein